MLGTDLTGSGVGTISGGLWENVRNQVVGQVSAGTLSVTGGTLTSQNGFVGQGTNNTPGVVGTATVTAGAWNNTLNLNIGGGIVTEAGGSYGGTLTAVGLSLIGSNKSVAAQFLAGPLVGTPGSLRDPLLAPLDDYGGLTQTMALRPGSPARDAATGSTLLTDQRGFPLVSTRDLGAYEAGTITNFANFIWETLPATEAQHAATFGFDGDGANNENEYLAGTIVTNPVSVLGITSFTRSGDTGSITFPTVLGRKYTFESSTALSDPLAWQPLTSGFVTVTGNPVTFPFGVASEFDRLFIRLRVAP